MKNVKLMSVVTTCLIPLVGITYVNTGWAKSVEHKVKDWIDECSEAIKEGIDKLGDDVEAIQDYLNNYPWKGLIVAKATSGPATLKHLELNNHSRAVVVKPGETIEAVVKCDLDSEQCSPLAVYRIVVGIKGEGPQVVIGNELGLVAGKTREAFALTAPDKPGIYQIRFRTVESLLETTALAAWKDEEGNEPDRRTTIGIIVVKS